MQDGTVAPSRVIRDEAFARRLRTACEGHPECPTHLHRGMQKWLREELSGNLGVTVSPEAVRKWFAGETRPRVMPMSAIAQVLGVDVAWLSLGAEAAAARKSLPAGKMPSNAVLLVSSLLRSAGGTVAPTAEGDAGDLHVILRERHLRVTVRSVTESEDGCTLPVEPSLGGLAVVVTLRTSDPAGTTCLWLGPEILSGALGQGADHLRIMRKGGRYVVGREMLPVMGRAEAFLDLI